MHTSLRVLAAVLAVGLPAAARAQCPAPGSGFDLSTSYFAFARINGSVFDFSCLITPSAGGTRTLSFGNAATPIASHAVAGTTAHAYLSNFSVTFDASGSDGGAAPDRPNITWSIATRTTLATSVVNDPTFDFAFAFGMPVAARPYESASTTEGFSISNANARSVEGVSLTPAGSFAPLAPAPGGYPAALFGPTGPLSRQAVYDQVLVGGVGTAGIGAGTTACTLVDPNQGARARQQTCEFDSGDQPLAATAGSFGLLIQYRQFGVLNNVTNGAMIVTPTSTVPEPGSLALVVTGALALLVPAARRRRAEG